MKDEFFTIVKGVMYNRFYVNIKKCLRSHNNLARSIYHIIKSERKPQENIKTKISLTIITQPQSFQICYVYGQCQLHSQIKSTFISYITR